MSRQAGAQRRIVCIGGVAMLVAAAAFLATAAPAAAAVPLKAMVTLAPGRRTLGAKITAAVNKSTKPAGDSLRTIRLSWGDGTKAVTLTNLRSRATHRYSHPGAFTVRLTLVDRHGKVARGSAVEHVTAAVGSYRGLSPLTGLRFYVSFGHPRVQDVSDFVQLHCSNNTALDDALIVPAAAISTGGSFAISRPDTGILNGQSAKYTYHFAGHFRWSSTSGARAVGTMRETIRFPDSGVTCTTNTLAWAAERDVQPAQHNTPPPAGSYRGLSPMTGLRFFVSNTRNRVQDVSDFVQLHCSNSTALDDALIVPAAAISTAGSFATSRTDTGILNGQSANYSYRLSGNFHSLAPDRAFRAAGTMRETISFPDSGVTCSTNTLAWTAERDTQPAQHNTPPPAGSYRGLSPMTGLRFFVSNTHTSVQDLSDPVQLHCSDSTALDDTLIVPAAAISAAGSFATSRTDTGILGGQSANYSYRLSGNFHSLAPDGAFRAAGTMRETITFPDSGVTCTTDTLAWTAERDTQPAQHNTPPPTGTYTGLSPFTGLHFTVASGTSIQTVSDPVQLHCSNNGAVDDTLVVPAAAINADGSFAATTTSSGTINGHPTHNTYSFRGNFHSIGPDQAERAAGTMRESLTFTDSGVTCTTNTEAWAAHRTG